MTQRFSSRENIRKLTLAAMLTAIVFVLQMLGSLIKPSVFSTASLVLIPIVIGAALLGWQYGAWLGFVFGAAVLISGDAAPFMELNPVGTFITVLVKGTVAGAVSGLVYEIFSKKQPFLGSIIAAVVCPVVNTAIFILGCRVFFWEGLAARASTAKAPSVAAYVILTLVGVNFIVELSLNIILSPVAVRLIRYGQSQARD